MQLMPAGQPSTVVLAIVVEADGVRMVARYVGETDPPPLEITGADGVTEFDAELADPVPLELVAVTVKVYVVPLLNPVTVIGDEAPVAVIPLGLDVTV